MVTQGHADIRCQAKFDFLPTHRGCQCPPERLNCLSRQEILELGSTVIDVKQRYCWQENHPARFILRRAIGTKSYFGLELTDELISELRQPPKRNRRIYRIETHWSYGGKPAITLNLKLLGVEFHDFADFPKGLSFVE